MHGLIAARLDTLPAERKRMLHDAAVVGKVFWSGAVAEMGECDEAEVRAVLHELARTDLVRPARRSSMEGQAEYAFTHALIREVCYGQIPRAGRAQRHQRAAAWIERTAGERAADHAEILAAHYTTALDLAQAAKDPHAGELAASAARYLMLAGDRAMGIDVETAERHFAHALQLTSDTTRRARSCWPATPKRCASGRTGSRRSSGMSRPSNCSAPGAMSFPWPGQWAATGSSCGHLGEARERTLSADALALVEPLGPSPALVQALAEEAGTRMMWGDLREAVEYAARALALAAQLGLPEPARALGFRGMAGLLLGDAAGCRTCARRSSLATAQGLGRDVAILYVNLRRARG